MSNPIPQAAPKPPAPKPAVPKPQVVKEDAMWLQKELINRNYHELATAHDVGRKISATFVPGNLNELLMCFDFARSLPETNALQNGMRKRSGKMILDAERCRNAFDSSSSGLASLGTSSSNQRVARMKSSSTT